MKSLNKKRAGIVGDLVNGTGGLIVGVIITLVIVSTLLGANLLTANSAEANVSEALRDNFTTGLTNVGNKIPTILLIAAVVLLFGVLVILVARAKQMNIGGSGSL